MVDVVYHSCRTVPLFLCATQEVFNQLFVYVGSGFPSYLVDDQFKPQPFLGVPSVENGAKGVDHFGTSFIECA